MNGLPPTFCWTKIGTEAGEDLASILRRKEWERQLGDGSFFWGIGHSLGGNAQAAAGTVESLRVFFSPMPSKPKAIDLAPTAIVLWNAWVDARGQTQMLPIHSFVTSRAFLPSGRKKERHYALVCESDRKLDQHPEFRVFPKQLRNLTTNKPLGASQVTAVVRVAQSSGEAIEARSYPVSFAAKLRFPYFVRLAQPSLLSTREIAQVTEVSDSEDLQSWSALVGILRSRLGSLAPLAQRALNFEKVASFQE